MKRLITFVLLLASMGAYATTIDLSQWVSRPLTIDEELSIVSDDSETAEGLSAWVGEHNITPDDKRFARFMQKGKGRRGVHVLYVLAKLEVLDTDLDRIVQEEFKTLRWGVEVDKLAPEDSKVLNYTSKSVGGTTLRDILLLKPYDLDGPTCIITLCAKDERGSMKKSQPAWRLGVWVEAVAPFGYTLEDFLTHEEALIVIEASENPVIIEKEIIIETKEK